MNGKHGTIGKTDKHYAIGKTGKHGTGCLIIHGFGGNYDEVSPLATRLKRMGYKVACPALAGHTGRRCDLKKAGYKDWIKAAERSLLKLLSRCRAVYIIGFSMGGLIAINLALKYEVAGIVTINTPIHYWDIRKILSNIAKGLTGGGLAPTKRYLRATVKFPLRALLNFRILLGRTRPLIDDIICPVLITQGLDDDTTRTDSARYIYYKLSSDVKRIKYYQNAGHLMLHSPAAGDVIRDIEHFLQEMS
ncbi:MAG: alpha/beta hydrolase [Clostridia bacterium]